MTEEGFAFDIDLDGNITEKLWKDWRVENSIQNRNRIFEFYFPWCRNIAGSLFLKYRHNLLEWSEFVNIASLAMLESIERFDSNLGTPFTAYCYQRVRGSVLNAIDKASATKKISAFADPIYYEYPSPGSESDSFETLIDATIEMALGMLLEVGIVQTPEDSGPQSFYEKEKTSSLLVKLVDELSETQRMVVKSYYFQQLSVKQIAKILSLSEARVSQLHREGLKNIRHSYEKLM